MAPDRQRERERKGVLSVLMPLSAFLSCRFSSELGHRVFEGVLVVRDVNEKVVGSRLTF